MWGSISAMWCRVTMSRHLSDSHMTLSHIWTFYSADQNSGRGRLLVFNISCIHIFHTKSFGSLFWSSDGKAEEEGRWRFLFRSLINPFWYPPLRRTRGWGIPGAVEEKAGWPSLCRRRRGRQRWRLSAGQTLIVAHTPLPLLLLLAQSVFFSAKFCFLIKMCVLFSLPASDDPSHCIEHQESRCTVWYFAHFSQLWKLWPCLKHRVEHFIWGDVDAMKVRWIPITKPCLQRASIQ